MTLIFKSINGLTYQERAVVAAKLHSGNELALMNALKDESAIMIEVSSAKHNVGKTTVAALIAECLKANGFHNVVVGCRDGDIASKAYIANGETIPPEVTSRTIVILDANLVHHPYMCADTIVDTDIPNSQ